MSNVPQNKPCDQNVPTGHIARTFWKYCWTNFKWLPTVMGGYIWGTCWIYNPNAAKMFSPIPDWTHVVGTFQMCPICYYHEIAGLIQPKLSMFSTCNHWFQAPLPPVIGWLLGDIQHFNKREHTLSSGWGHYPTTHEVISLFISAWRNTGGSLDHPRHLPWNHQRRGGCSGRPLSLVEWRLSQPFLWWSPLGSYDSWGWVALCSQPDKN